MVRPDGRLYFTRCFPVVIPRSSVSRNALLEAYHIDPANFPISEYAHAEGWCAEARALGGAGCAMRVGRAGCTGAGCGLGARAADLQKRATKSNAGHAIAQPAKSFGLWSGFYAFQR